MNEIIAEQYISILQEELVPAMGCTEPVAVAYAAAVARKTLGSIPNKVDIRVSRNIVKNVKSVVVPNTGHLRGIEAAAAAGITAGEADKKLEVICGITSEQIKAISEYLKNADFSVSEIDSDVVFMIEIHVSDGEHSATVVIANEHTNITLIKKDDTVVFCKDCRHETAVMTDRSLLNVEKIVEFADTVSLERVEDILLRQIQCNLAIAKEGLNKDYGAGIGKILLKSYGNDVSNRAKAWAAAGSDARMNGCEMPVVINSGSGNQGITCSIPVIIYANELEKTQEELMRALIVSNLVTIHLKDGIGCLSAYCGATSAGCGAGAGVTYLYGGRYKEIAHTIVNALAINSGVICDGAKASCAAKIASAVDAGLLGMNMYKHGSQFYGGDGIVTKGVEATIHNVNILAKEGMKETDRTIINIML